MKGACCIFWLLLIHFFSAASSYDVYEENGKVGLKNDAGKVLIPARFDALGWSNTKFTVLNNVIGYRSGSHWGLVSLDNEVITKPLYEEVYPAEGLFVIARKKSNLSLRVVTGCLTISGKQVLPFEYDGVSIHNNRAIVFTKIGNEYKYGLVDLENKTLIPQQFMRVSSVGAHSYAVKNFDGRMALYANDGKPITGFAIDSISTFKNNYAILYQNAQQGLIDGDGEIKLQPVFREVRIDVDGSVFTRQLDEWYFLDGQNKLFQTKQADSIRAIGKNLLCIVSAGTTHLEDYKLKPTSTKSYSTLGNFVKGKAIFSINGKYGIARTDGTIVIPAQYDKIYFDRQFVITNQIQGGKNNWTALDSTGRILNSKAYERIHPFTGKIFPVVNRNFWGAIDASGKEIIACAYDSILQNLKNYVVIKFKQQYGVLNLQEEWKVTPRPNRIKLLAEDRFLEIGPKTTYLKSFDGTTIYFTDNKIDAYATHLTEYLPSGNVWEVDLDGVIVNRKIQPDGSLERIYPEAEGLRGIKKNGQYGFIDSQGRLRIANRYAGIQPFSESLAAVKLVGKWGFINREDKIAIQPVYDEVTPFKMGFSIVRQKGFQGLVDKTGKVILPTRYELIRVLNDGNVLFKQGGLLGLADRDGKILINPKYNILEELNNNYVVVARDNKYGVISVKGISTVPLIYDLITYDRYNNYFLALKKAAWLKSL
ncbi:MAG: WG repeat-containing protein [Chryseolinea sp.]